MIVGNPILNDPIFNDSILKKIQFTSTLIQLINDATLFSPKKVVYFGFYCILHTSIPNNPVRNWQRVLSTLKSNFTTRPEAWKGQKIYKQANRLSKFLPDSDSVTQYELAKKVNDEDFLKVVSVRHPLTRLLSAWRDKFQMVESSKYGKGE